MSSAPQQRETSHRPYRSGLYWKLLASFAVLSLAAIALLTWLFSRSYESLLARELDDRLNVAAVTSAQLLIDRWPTEVDPKVQALVQAIGRRTRVRLTLIDAKGHVLADSDEPNVAGVEGMEPHGNRLEVIEALHNGSGGARRTSPTMNDTQQYFAVCVGMPDAPLGVVRVSYPTRSIDDEIAAFARGLAITGGLTALAAIAATAWITALATRPLRDLATAADALLAGKYDHRLPVTSPNGDELGAVSRALAEASQRLERGERQLRSTTQTQATILEGMSESVIAVDRHEHVLFANNSAGRLLGFRPEKVERLPLLEAVRSHELREAVQRALRTKQLANSELTWRTGSARTFDVLATPLPGDPSPGVVLVLRDISEVKRLERMRQQFIANVSHELKTPLSSIKAYTETLLGGARNDAVHCERFLNRIDEQAGRLQELILDMLSLARIESGQAALDLADVSVARVVNRCVTDYEPQAIARELVLENLATDGAVKVHADEEALRQILSNLIDNALKYTPAGGRVSIRCQPNGKMAEIEVSDTGVGIASEHHEHLFERFYRVDKARSRELGGTGLGLSIVKHLSQVMGGGVSVRSELKKGSTFAVRLPLAKS